MRSNKSTNVRVAHYLFGALERFSPDAAAALAQHIFFRTPARRPRIESEQAILARASDSGDGALVRVRSYRWGEGPVALLVHGWGGDAGQMTPFVEPLLEAGFAVVAFDAPGHGRSEGRATSLV